VGNAFHKGNNSVWGDEPESKEGMDMKLKSINALAAATCLLPALPCWPADAPADRLEEVVVTAQRREEKLQDVPVSVIAFNETAIRQAGIRNTADFLAMTPNVSFDQSFTVGNSFVTMRGVEQINNADSPVAVIIDGVPQGNQKQLKMELFDVERIEVLEGPQGALYGRNAIGGAINIITKQPTNDFSGFAQIGAGSGTEREGVVALSGPIIPDKLLFRVSGEYKTADGQISNSYLNEKVDFYTAKDVRAKLLWLATDAFSVDTRFAHTDNSGGAIYDVAIPNTVTDPTNIQNLDPHADILGNSQLRSDESTLKADWKLSPGTLTWITGYTKLNEKYYGSLGFCNPIDCPGGFFGLGSLDQHQDLDVRLVSHELRLTSNANQPLRYIVGAYYLDTRRNLLTTAHLLDVPGEPEIVNNNEHNKNTAYAGFGQLDWDFAAATTLGISGRYDKDERNQTDAATGNERSVSFDAFQPKVTLSQKFDPNQLGYLTYSTGFRSGGFNGIGQLQPFKEELLRNFEVGYKSTWLDQRLTFNVAAFIERDTGFQFFYVDLAAGGAQVISNLNSVQLGGAEIETQGVLAPGWTAYFNVGLLNSKIRAFDASLGVPAAVGNKTPKTVPDKFNLGTQKEWSFTDFKTVLRVDFEYRGKKYWDTSNVDVMNPVKLLSARASIKRGAWELALSGRNLLNHYYFEDFNAKTFSGLPNNIGWPAQPRSVEATIRYDF
jgi:iron complex outermembrane receptor protein